MADTYTPNSGMKAAARRAAAFMPELGVYVSAITYPSLHVLLHMVQ